MCAWLMAGVSPPQRARCDKKYRPGVLNETIWALRRDFLFLHSASEATIEELVTEVMGEILREVAGNMLSVERQRVQEERRRVEEER